MELKPCPFCGGKAEPCQLFQINLWRMGGVVCEKQDPFSAFAQMLNQTDGKRKGTVAEVNGAVHIKNKQFFAFQKRNGGIFPIHFCNFSQQAFFSLIISFFAVLSIELSKKREK